MSSNASALPPLLKDVDVSDIVIKNSYRPKFGTTFNLSRANGKDIMFYFGTAKTRFGVAQSRDPSAKEGEPIAPERPWQFSVNMGWENARTVQEDENCKKLEEIRDAIAKVLATATGDAQIVDAENEALNADQIKALIADPVVMKRSKTKKQDNPNKPGKQEFVPYEPVMKWNVPFGFVKEGGKNVRDLTRFLVRPGFKVFKDEDNNAVDGTTENATRMIPPNSIVEIWGRIPSIHVDDESAKRGAYIRFETLMVKRISQDENPLGQDIDTSVDYAQYLSEMQE